MPGPRRVCLAEVKKPVLSHSQNHPANENTKAAPAAQQWGQSKWCIRENLR